MSREYRTLKEVIMNLITVSDAFEMVRGKFSKYNKQDLLQAQEYIVAAINCLKKGVTSIDKGIRAENDAAEAAQLEQEELDKAEEEQGE